MSNENTSEKKPTTKKNKPKKASEKTNYKNNKNNTKHPSKNKKKNKTNTTYNPNYHNKSETVIDFKQDDVIIDEDDNKKSYGRGPVNIFRESLSDADKTTNKAGEFLAGLVSVCVTATLIGIICKVCGVLTWSYLAIFSIAFIPLALVIGFVTFISTLIYLIFLLHVIFVAIPKNCIDGFKLGFKSLKRSR